jgi:hypothetical protein
MVFDPDFKKKMKLKEKIHLSEKIENWRGELKKEMNHLREIEKELDENHFVQIFLIFSKGVQHLKLDVMDKIV